jgi:hypothetical protein
MEHGIIRRWRGTLALRISDKNLIPIEVCPFCSRPALISLSTSVTPTISLSTVVTPTFTQAENPVVEVPKVVRKKEEKGPYIGSAPAEYRG